MSYFIIYQQVIVLSKMEGVVTLLFLIFYSSPKCFTITITSFIENEYFAGYTKSNHNKYLQNQMHDQYIYTMLYKYGDQLYQAFSALKNLFYRKIRFYQHLEDDHFPEPIADKIVEPII